MFATILALLMAGAPLAAHAQQQPQPGQTTTTKSELSITALSPTGQSTTVKFPGIPGLSLQGGIPKCGADTGIDAQKTSANEAFCRTLRTELAKLNGDVWKDVAKGGDIKIVGFASSESTTTSPTGSSSSTGNGQNGGNASANGGQGGAAGQGGNSGTAAASTSAATGISFCVQSLAGFGLVVAGAAVM
ncbi:hypothetical protein BCR44DRAFT_40995 [Catenaria anguillulae PL171]|uniref:Uncharacterized protein n=1 Tax=Catenaria anguillulae PL171 TaxID=765915 RepID=A0A1Y2HK91_9FUNG|nr:hypothetical protein BCR44DRAFT_40995 [Catenaria anguillulae PL171]